VHRFSTAERAKPHYYQAQPVLKQPEG